MHFASMLPYHPKIALDESISSYLRNLSRGYGLSISDFLAVTRVQKAQGVWHSGDVDSISSSLSLLRLASVTGQEVRQLRWSTLSSSDGLLSIRRGARVYQTSWIYGAADGEVSSRARAKRLIQFCHSCLQEAEPYFRITWRFSFMTICPKHMVFLQDSCPGCSRPFAATEIHSAEESAAAFRCFDCQFDLRRRGGILDAERLLPSTLTTLLRVQGIHLTLLRFSQRTEKQKLATYLFFLGALLAILIGDETPNRQVVSLRRLLCHRYDLGPSKTWTLDGSERRFDFLPARERTRYLLMASAVLDPWPHQLMSLSESSPDFSRLSRSKDFDRLSWRLNADGSSNDLQPELLIGTSLAHHFLRHLLTVLGDDEGVRSELVWSSPAENLAIAAFEHEELSFKNALRPEDEQMTPFSLEFEVGKLLKLRRTSTSRSSSLTLRTSRRKEKDSQSSHK